jgi:hypothetical protein
MTVYSGNHAGWLNAVAHTIMDGGAKPPSMADLERLVPRQVGTARNDGHVTAAANGLDRDDYHAGYRVWLAGAVTALRKAKLVDGADDTLRWAAPADGRWKVSFAGHRITVLGQQERRESRARHMLGEPDPTGQQTATRPGLLLQGHSAPLKVNVRTQSGGRTYIRARELEIHPLALAIPPMSAAEQTLVLNDIETNGVKVPVVLYPDPDDPTARGKPKLKVLDGRHRTYFASVTGQPIVLEEFEGTEEEARQHVISLNLNRRQLTRQQRALAIERLYGRQAREQAAQDRTRKPAESVPGSLPEQNGRTRGQEAHERAWAMAGGKASGVSKDDVKAAALIAQAPETAAKVDAGEVRSTAEAVRAAKAELNGVPIDRSAGAAVSKQQSTTQRMGKALYELNAVKREWQQPAPEADRVELHARAGEIIYLGRWIQQQLDGP